MHILIVYAHPEPKSFNGALKDLAVSVLTDQGHEVQVSDLYEMGFKAVADQRDFQELANHGYFNYQAEQAHAQAHGTFSADIRAEQEKIRWADWIIFQFPLWWVSPPAILKGWIDRVLAFGFAYRPESDWYDRGLLKGRKAMLSITTDHPSSMYTARGLHGDINHLLAPIHLSVLYFVGMEVVPPFIAWASSRVDDQQRRNYLSAYEHRLRHLEVLPILPFFPLSKYDEHFMLKPELDPQEPYRYRP